MDYLQYIGEDPLKMYWRTEVLNLIINGLPSILGWSDGMELLGKSFKPYYKWITFNTVI